MIYLDQISPINIQSVWTEEAKIDNMLKYSNYMITEMKRLIIEN